MVFYSVAGGRLFSLELLLLMASLHYYASLANGQQGIFNTMLVFYSGTVMPYEANGIHQLSLCNTHSWCLSEAG